MVRTCLRVYSRIATIPSSISRQVLVDLLKAELQNALSQVQDHFAEMVKRWSAGSIQTTQAATTGMLIAPGIRVRFSAMGIKLEKPEKFTGAPAALENWLFNVKQLCKVHGILDGTDMVKLAITLLSERALMWQRAESIKPWATIGVLDW